MCPPFLCRWSNYLWLSPPGKKEWYNHSRHDVQAAGPFRRPIFKPWTEAENFFCLSQKNRIMWDKKLIFSRGLDQVYSFLGVEAYDMRCGLSMVAFSFVRQISAQPVIRTASHQSGLVRTVRSVHPVVEELSYWIFTIELCHRNTSVWMTLWFEDGPFDLKMDPLIWRCISVIKKWGMSFQQSLCDRLPEGSFHLRLLSTDTYPFGDILCGPQVPEPDVGRSYGFHSNCTRMSQEVSKWLVNGL